MLEKALVEAKKLGEEQKAVAAEARGLAEKQQKELDALRQGLTATQSSLVKEGRRDGER